MVSPADAGLTYLSAPDEADPSDVCERLEI
jgi:hypothetical protein